MATQFRFEILPDLPMEEAEASLHLATFSCEGLYGPARVRMEGTFHVDDDRRVITIDANEIGETLSKVYTGFLLREFGEAAFRVRRIEAPARSEPIAVAGCSST